MSDVTRFTCNPQAEMAGEFVLYSDYEEIETKLAIARAELRRYEEITKAYAEEWSDMVAWWREDNGQFGVGA